MYHNNRTRFLHRTFLFLILFMVTVMAVNAEPYRVVGYYPAWMRDAYPAEAVDVSALTHVIYAFAWPREDGTLASYEHPSYPELASRVHAAGGTMAIALGGGGQSTGFGPATANPGMRASFIANILDFCRQHGYDGVDIDWERPQNEAERDNLTALVRELRTAASGGDEPFVITVAVSGATWANRDWDFGALAPLVDWFNVMHYDYSGPWTTVAGHNAPLYPRSDLGLSLCVDASVDYLTGTLGVPRDKVLVGIPFYGRMFQAEDIYEAATGGDAYRYPDIAEMLSSGEWLPLWDPIAEAPYAVNEDRTSVIVYDDERSIAGKCEYVRENGLGGVMIWALGYDYRDSGTPLLDTIGRVLGTPVYVAEASEGVPEGIVMYPVMPNPFNASATITYTLPRDMNVSVDIYSISGQRVARLREGFVRSGRHIVTWNADGFAAGIYFASIHGEGFRASEKMVLLK